MRCLTTAVLALLLVCRAASAAQPASPADAAGVEFFENRIRPLLAEHCYPCHGPQRQRSGLALSSVAGILQGGDRGPLIVPGAAEQSLLIQAVRYEDDDLRMPPKGKLKPEQIADLTAWVKRGAPLPREESPAAVALSDFDLNERRKHWAYQPLHAASLPAVKNAAWGTSPIDDYILSRLEAAGLSPAPPAEKRTLIRRLTFDLTGLPPTTREVAEFLADTSPDAYERLVDRLLASPHYGERWARHWLDVVRYGETCGFEFDYDLHNAWRYRDYVVRAFNDDLPYDRFVIEHLAGDLLPQPRRNPADGANESILATGFFWMGEGKQSPVDIRQEQADRIDNQIDVLGKAFLAQTIACARCHDHKFDAISTRDYYALAGYLKSSRYQQAFLDPPARIAPQINRLTSLKQRIRELAPSALAELWLQELAHADRYLLATRSVLSGGPEANLQQAALEFEVDSQRLDRWVKAFGGKPLDIHHPLYAWRRMSAERDAEPELAPRRADTQVFTDFRRSGCEGWSITGDAFGMNPAKGADVMLGDRPERPIAQLVSGGFHSGLLSRRLQGELRSPTFTLEKPYIHYRLAGSAARVNLVIDGYTLIMNPMYGKLTIAPEPQLAWRTMPVDRWIGHRAYIEASDSSIPMHGLNPPPSSARVPEGPRDGYVWLQQIVLSDDPEPPAEPDRRYPPALADARAKGLEALAAAYREQMASAVKRWRTGELADAPDREEAVALLNWLLDCGLLDIDAESAAVQPLRKLLDEHQEIEATLPPPSRAPALADGTGEDEFVFLRGNHRTPGERAPRGPPEVLACSDALPASSGSGRLELARRLVDPANPLVARVMVNRLWQHHFGEGLVRTPDDFGRMGQAPTHPELLDFLAAELIRRGWSLKAMHRLMLCSSTYRMCSSAEFGVRSAESKPESTSSFTPHSAFRTPHSLDPENRLLSRMPVRRLEAEALRDALLHLSGRLEPALEGPSVLPYLTAHMEGRGRPKSGPLDGEGRRSVYLNARRNFLTPMFVAFDYPAVFTTVGRRGVTTVPTQALTLMNDPFVIEQARLWSQRVRASSLSPEARIDALYQSAFARAPSDRELQDALAFLSRQSVQHAGNLDDAQAWTDLCHVLINVKEFLFLD